jgi:hypothetical protein
MAQVGVQQPSNLMEMFSSPSPMLWDIASQQVNDQTLGNSLNRAQATQDMQFDAEKHPFELSKLGLENQTAEARLPGVRATSSKLEDEAQVSRANVGQRQKTDLAELISKSSKADLDNATQGIELMMASDNPQIRAHGQKLYAILGPQIAEKLKQDRQTAGRISEIKESGAQQRLTDAEAAKLGKWAVKNGKPTTAKALLPTLKKPSEIDATIRQILADPTLTPEEQAEYEQRLAANSEALQYESIVKTMASQGKIDLSKLPGANLETIKPPAVPAASAKPASGAQRKPLSSF